MTVSISFDVDEGAVQRLAAESGLVNRKVREVTERVADECRALAPSRDGGLRSSIRTAVHVHGDLVTGYVYSDLDYSLYVQTGTGVYGPSGVPIRPRRAKFLVFTDGGTTVFARQVKGQRPRPFMVEALHAGSPWPVTEGSL